MQSQDFPSEDDWPDWNTALDELSEHDLCERYEISKDKEMKKNIYTELKRRHNISKSSVIKNFAGSEATHSTGIKIHHNTQNRQLYQQI